MDPRETTLFWRAPTTRQVRFVFADGDGRYSTTIAMGGVSSATELLKSQASLAVYDVGVTFLFDRNGDQAYQISTPSGRIEKKRLIPTIAPVDCKLIMTATIIYAINQFKEVIILEKSS